MKKLLCVRKVCLVVMVLMIGLSLISCSKPQSYKVISSNGCCSIHVQPFSTEECSITVKDDVIGVSEIDYFSIEDRSVVVKNCLEYCRNNHSAL